MAKEKARKQQAAPGQPTGQTAPPTKNKKKHAPQTDTALEPELTEEELQEAERSKPTKRALGKKQPSYPTKTDMNLFYRVDKTTRPATAMLYFLFALVLLLALGKFGIYDFMVQRDAARNTLTASQDKLTAYSRELADYNDVLERYTRYSYGYLTDEEAALVDRIQALGLIEEVLMRGAEVSTLSINGNTVAVTFSGVSLDEVASLKKKLESDDMVVFVSVNTAATEGELKAVTPVADPTSAQNEYTTMGGDMPVMANMLIYLAQVEEGGQN